jgi:hypothetical protein
MDRRPTIRQDTNYNQDREEPIISHSHQFHNIQHGRDAEDRERLLDIRYHSSQRPFRAPHMEHTIGSTEGGRTTGAASNIQQYQQFYQPSQDPASPSSLDNSSWYYSQQTEMNLPFPESLQPIGESRSSPGVQSSDAHSDFSSSAPNRWFNSDPNSFRLPPPGLWPTTRYRVEEARRDLPSVGHSYG